MPVTVPSPTGTASPPSAMSSAAQPTSSSSSAQDLAPAAGVAAGILAFAAIALM